MTVDFDATVLVAANAAFGTTVYYYTALTGPLTLTGIFNDKYQETKFDGGLEVTETSIVLGIRAALFPVEPVRGEYFRVRGILYVISDPPEADGLGDLKIRLRAASNEEAARMRLPPGSR